MGGFKGKAAALVAAIKWALCDSTFIPCLNVVAYLSSPAAACEHTQTISML